VSKTQLSTILCYVTDEGVQERFLGYIDVSSDRSATCLSEHVFYYLLEYKCENKKIN